MKMMLSLFACVMFLGLLMTACGGDEDTSYHYDTAATDLTTDQIAGMWKVESTKVLKNTCPDDGEEEESFDFLQIGKVDAANVSTLKCKDAACAQADPDGAKNYPFGDNKITGATPGKTLVMDMSSMGADCKIYVDILDDTAYFQSVTQFTSHSAIKMIYEGTQCVDDNGNKAQSCTVEVEAIYKKLN